MFYTGVHSVGRMLNRQHWKSLGTKVLFHGVLIDTENEADEDNIIELLKSIPSCEDMH